MQPDNASQQPPQPTDTPQPDVEWQQPAAPTVSEATVVDQPATAPPPGPVENTPQPLNVAEALGSEATFQTLEAEQQAPEANPGEDQLIRWSATEHIHREKNAIWYAIFAVIVVLLMAAAFFLMKSWTFAVLVPVMAAALVLYAKRPPAEIDYTLSRKGLHVNDKLYGFELFKEFGLVHDDDENAVVLVPRKRFQPGVTVYFPDEVGEVVVDMLAARLPMHEVRIDPIDRLIRALRI